VDTTSNTTTINDFNGIPGAKRVSQEGRILVEDVYVGDYQKPGTLTAQLRQVHSHTTTYPASQVIDSLTDMEGLFTSEDYNLEEGSSYENVENRVTWINVPEGVTKEGLQAKLDALGTARLYRILSNTPILTDGQKRAVTTDELDVDLDYFADRDAVRDSDTNELRFDQNGKVQYRNVFFTATGKADEDRRTADTDDFYASETILAEMQVGETADSFELQDDQVF
jgi:hypothetical protein